jgi:hypothetical protein
VSPLKNPTYTLTDAGIQAYIIAHAHITYLTIQASSVPGADYRENRLVRKAVPPRPPY